MRAPWRIGNLKTDKPEKLVSDIITGNTPALNAAKRVTWAELAERYGDVSSERVFSAGDCKMYLFNRYSEEK